LLSSHFSTVAEDKKPKNGNGTLMAIPPHRAHKVCTAEDAVSLISSGDTICVSGFVGQGSPDKILHALSKRYEEEHKTKDEGTIGTKSGAPTGLHNLTLLFGGGPGDWDGKGLNYLGNASSNPEAPPLIHRSIGSHYGQVPKLANLVTSNQMEAWALPLGSISRMIRAQATHSPGHLTTVGLGTYVDPEVGSAGAANELAAQSPLNAELVTKLKKTIGGTDYLLYKALPIQVAIIRATTADSMGNLSLEDESVLCDQRIIAMAARNSGGVVLAQVKRLCSDGSIPARSVGVPGALVDCVVVVDEHEQDEYHPMSYTMKQNPVLTSEIKSPVDKLPRMDLTERKIVARRASMALRPGQVVNLGIGLPEGIASVAREEGMLDYVTLTTEAGVFGGLPGSGRDFGPAYNADAFSELNAMFDYYDGSGLDAAFLGAAQINARGDVNVSRMSKDKITGPGGFIDISQSTRNVTFLSSFTASGLKLDVDGVKGEVRVKEEGKIKKFVSNVNELTFAGDEAVRRGQNVCYVTERAVFRRTAAHDVLELIEIAPGIDLQKDILEQMEFKPVISPDLKLMDKRIFLEHKMEVELLGSLESRCGYHPDDHTVYINLFNVSLQSKDEVDWFWNTLDEILSPLTEEKGPVDVVVDYDGFDLRSGLEREYMAAMSVIEKKHYKSVKRYTTKAFRRAKLKKEKNWETWDAATEFAGMDDDKDGILSPAELRRGIQRVFGISLKPADLDRLCGPTKVTNQNFTSTVLKALKS